MALKRFPLSRYATLEMNQVAFQKTGLVVSQTPLGNYFTEDAPCENGMWVHADKSNGVIKPIAAVTDTPLGIVYTAEKLYDENANGLKHFAHRPGAYPRVGIMQVGDTFTTNCLQYDDGEFANEDALYAALDAWETTPVYVVAVAGSPVPKLTATAPASGAYAKVTKFYTVPNGERGVKYQIIKL